MNEIIKVLVRTIFFYFFSLIMFRVMGKREVGQLGVIDLVVSILIAELIAISIENLNDSIMKTIFPIISLVILELLLAHLSLKSKRFRTFFDGKPSLIIDKGKINYKEMVRQRYTIDDLLFELRQKGIKSLANVDYALLESNGKLSIFETKFNDKDYPLPLIIDGVILTSTLKQINKTTVWLNYKLKKNDIDAKNVFYCFYKKNHLFIIKKKDLRMLS